MYRTDRDLGPEDGETDTRETNGLGVADRPGRKDRLGSAPGKSRPTRPTTLPTGGRCAGGLNGRVGIPAPGQNDPLPSRSLIGRDTVPGPGLS